MSTEGIQNQYSRAEIAEALEISGNQILQYQERGLLADRSSHAQDIAYNSLDIARLRFILRCEAAGYQGNDIVDFIGTINKGASIKEQLKASLVHAHQKFSYVNAQKRKADILEQVNLQADADLIQKYIDEMKGILANPQVSLIATSNKSRRTQTARKPERPPLPERSPLPERPPLPERSSLNERLSAFESEQEQATRFEPKEKHPNRLTHEDNRSSRLRAGLERSQRFQSERKQPAGPSRVTPQKNRNQFIDSSSGGGQYGPRISDTSSEMFMDYSGRRKPMSSTAWKQTLFTFLLLSLLSIAGYTYYALKYQKPSIEYITGANEGATKGDSQSQPGGTKDISSAFKKLFGEKDRTLDSQDDLETEKVTSKPQEKLEDPESTSTVSEEEPPKSKPTVPAETEYSKDKSSESTPTETVEVTPPAKPTAAVSPDKSTNNSASTIRSQEPESSPAPTPTDSTSEESLSGTAMKDLDDLIAEKQRTVQPQPTSDVYAIEERPQVAVYDFKLFYQRSRKILIAKFKMARIRPQRNLIQGRLFVVFKPRQSVQNSKYFTVPDARIAEGIPTEPFKGIEFSFSESTKVQSVRTIYVRDPSQFDVATIFIFSNAGELVLRKDFTVNITEY